MLFCCQTCTKLFEDRNDTFVAYNYIPTVNNFFFFQSYQFCLFKCTMGRVFLIIKYVSGLCGFQLYGTGVKSSILQQPRAQEFVEDLRRNLLLQCCEILLDQLAPTRSFRLLPLLVICFETFALCLKNVCMCKTIQICSFHSVVLQQEGQAELLFHLLPKKISL